MNIERKEVEQKGSSENPVAVVAIGASTASASSLQTLLTQIPHNSGAAFVVILQSEDGVTASEFVTAISQGTNSVAHVATDGERLQPDQYYVLPDDRIGTIEGGHLRLAARQQQDGSHGAVDTFLISLAEQQGEAAIGILLTENEEDIGSIGFARLKECGGLAIAATEAAETAAPGSVEPDGASGLADMVVPLDEIPSRLLSHIEHLRDLDEAEETAVLIKDGEGRLPVVATILRNRTGHDFHGYKPNTFLRRIQRRMHVVRVSDIDTYLERLRADPEEVQALFQDLLIGVTQFFRDPAEFEVLEQQVIPELLKNRVSDHHLRVWVLGCATGEEAYSIAILLREAIAHMDAPPYIQIFATDIDARALAVARTGRYPHSIERDVSAERLQRWFVKEGGTYSIHKDLREMCIFSAHNIIKDAPFSRIDLISCRNLLIYLKSDLQARVIPLFHFSLRQGGYLFLGPSENVTRHAKLFQPIDRKRRIFRRQDTPTRVLPEFPLTALSEPRRAAGDVPSHVRRLSNGTLAKRADRVVERYAPAYVIVDAEYEILNFSGRTGPYLDPSSGVANLNLLNLIHRDLRLDLRAALHKAAAERKPVRLAQLRMGDEGDTRRVGVSIEPIIDDTRDALHFVILFHDYGAELGVEGPDASRDPAMLRDEHVQRLENELRITKDRLQATIEELESTNEELKSSNEEYQSINEELQSANEELETSKEELQSVNEELQTVNGELAHRVAELAQANSDLKNLLESTQIATLFLDNDLRVKSFTPSMSEVFHLIDTDLGRPIAHIASRVPYPELGDDVRRVLRTLSTIERQIGPAEGPQYLVRILPYRSVDNFIAGAVLTFLDITETIRAQAALRVAEERSRVASSAARIVTWQLDIPSGKFVHSDQFEQTFGSLAPATLDAMLAMVHAEDREGVALAFEQVSASSGKLEAEGRFVLSGRELWVRFIGARSNAMLLGVFQDVNDRHRAAAQQLLLTAELQHRVKNILAVVHSMTQRTIEGSKSLDDFSKTFSGRIEALARTQALLANRAVEGIDLESLIREELAPKASRTDQFALGGPRIALRDKAAEAFSLATHELATNAAKHGAFSVPNGHIAINWRILNTSVGPRLCLEWRESGVDVPAAPARSGFGRKLIERVCLTISVL